MLAISLLTFSSVVYATEPDSTMQIDYLDNGDYIITTIETKNSGIVPFSNTVKKSKTAKYYHNNAAKWYVKVTGTFTYGNGNAQCTMY